MRKHYVTGDWGLIFCENVHMELTPPQSACGHLSLTPFGHDKSQLRFNIPCSIIIIIITVTSSFRTQNSSITTKGKDYWQFQVS